MKRNRVRMFLKDNYVRLVPALVIAVAAGGLGITYLVQSMAAELPTKITNTVQNLTLGGPPVDANTSALASTARVGDTLQYAITITNSNQRGLLGGTELSGVKVSVPLQQGIQYTTDPAAKVLSIEYGTIPAGQAVVRKFQVKVLPSASSTIMQNVACYTSAAKMLAQAEKGCDSAFTRTASANAAAAQPRAVAAVPTPAPAARPTPAPAPAVTAADCSSTADATAKAGSAGADITVPTRGATAIQISYGLDSSNLDAKSSLTPATGDSTVAMLTNLKPGSTYSYQVIRQCSDGQYKTSDTNSFSTEKMNVNVVFVNDNNDPLEGITSNASCAPESKDGKSDSTGLVTFSGVSTGDCKLTYNYESKECSDAMPVPQPVLSGEKSAADAISLTYRVKACANQTPTEDPSKAAANSSGSSKLVYILGAISAILAALLVRSYLKNRSGGGPDGPGDLSGPSSNSDNDGFVPPVDMPPTPPNSQASVYDDSDDNYKAATATAETGSDPYTTVDELQQPLPPQAAALAASDVALNSTGASEVPQLPSQDSSTPEAPVADQAANDDGSLDISHHPDKA